MIDSYSDSLFTLSEIIKLPQTFYFMSLLADIFIVAGCQQYNRFQYHWWVFVNKHKLLPGKYKMEKKLILPI